MDRRQRKTRDAIFEAFGALLQKKKYEKITVGEILTCADVGRATFYAHFETKEHLLKVLCEELFCHVFDAAAHREGHTHIFDCEPPESAYLHLLQHLERNDHQILKLLTGQNRALFLPYFKKGLEELVECVEVPDHPRSPVPDTLYRRLLATAFVECVAWWTENGMRESAETLHRYFLAAVGQG